MRSYLEFLQYNLPLTVINFQQLLPINILLLLKIIPKDSCFLQVRLYI